MAKGTRFESIDAVKQKATETKKLTEYYFLHGFDQWKILV